MFKEIFIFFISNRMMKKSYNSYFILNLCRCKVHILYSPLYHSFIINFKKSTITSYVDRLLSLILIYKQIINLL